jgi:hypothetical protein
MEIYKAGTRYFSSYQEAKLYREKYFSSSRWIETINVEENTIKPDEDIVVSVSWSTDVLGKLYVRSYWCIGTVSDLLKTDTYLNILNVSRPRKGMAVVRSYLAFRNMRAARYRINSRKFLEFIESEVSKIPIGSSEVQVKI